MKNNHRLEKVFTPYPEKLTHILQRIDVKKYALPKFQRGWVWDQENIKELLVSVIQAFPAGSLLLLRYNEDRLLDYDYFTGVKMQDNPQPEFLVLDGQQRLTSLYQVLSTESGVIIGKPSGKKETFFFYLDIFNLMKGELLDRVIFHVDKSRILKEFKNLIKYDVSNLEKEFENGCLPLNIIFRSDEYRKWRKGIVKYYKNQKNYDDEKAEKLDDDIEKIHELYLKPILQYEFPVIELNQETSLSAICHIFEKVNTAGVDLNVFELLTAVLWAQGVNLKERWDKTHGELKYIPHFEGITIDSITFLQTVSLLVTFNKKKDNPDMRVAITCRRDDLLNLTAQDVNLYWEKALNGFKKAAKILYENGIYATQIMPYKTMLPPLCSILEQTVLEKGDIKTDKDYEKIRKWFWTSVFSQRYSSGSETKSAVDFEQIMKWLNDESEIPDVIRLFDFNAEMIYEVTSKTNAIYKGLLCLMLKNKPLDFRSGFEISTQIFHDEKLDDHHVFPKESEIIISLLANDKITKRLVNCIVNRVLIDASTNRHIKHKNPSKYLSILAKQYASQRIEDVLNSHFITKVYLDEDDFTAFIEDRKQQLLKLIMTATGCST